MMRMWARGVVAVVLLLAVPTAARADKNADEALRLYQEGTNAYNLGEFAEAVTKYKAAFKLRAEPVFLYNIAQAYRLSGDFKEALFFYKSYLRSSPNAQNRAEVEGRIRDMEEQLKKAQDAAGASPTGTITPPGPGEPPGSSPQPSASPEPSPSPSASPARVPSPGEVADASAAGKENGTPPGPATDSGGGKKPIYKKWWFWAGVGAVAVGATALALTLGGGGGGAPDTDHGTTKVF